MLLQNIYRSPLLFNVPNTLTLDFWKYFSRSPPLLEDPDILIVNFS